MLNTDDSSTSTQNNEVTLTPTSSSSIDELNKLDVDNNGNAHVEHIGSSTNSTVSTDALASASSSSFYQDLFRLYDQEQNGYITVDRFLNYTKENSDTWENDKMKINQLVKILDPLSQGKINYENFVAGIKKLTTSNDDDELSNENTKKLEKSQDESIDLMYDIDRKSNSSPFSNSNDNDTFNEYDTESQLNNKTNNTDTSTHNSTSQLMSLMGESNLLIDVASSLDKTISSSSTEKYNNGETSYANLSFDLLNLDDKIQSSQISNEKLTNISNNGGNNSDDPFGFFLVDDKSSLNNLENSMSKSSFKRLNFVSSKQIANGLYSNSLNNTNSNSNSSNTYEIINDSSKNSTSDENEDEAIEKYENKIKELTHEIEYLSSEKNEIVNKLSQLNNDNSNLAEKIRELEEINIELEKKFNQKLSDQEFRHNEIVNKMNKTLEYERYNHHQQLANLEKEMSFYKEENSKYYKELIQINKKIEQTDEKLNEESDKYVKVKSEFEKLFKENQLVHQDLETERNKYKEKIELLQNELNESQIRLQNQAIKYRGYTISINEESYLNNRVKELENEVSQLKSENNHLLNSNEDLKAQIIKSNLDNGRILLHNINAPSLAAEMGLDTISRDELMEKYKNEQQMTKRLSEYLESILSKIMLHNPEILEVREVSNNKSTATNKNVDVKQQRKESITTKSGGGSGPREFFRYRKNSDKIKLQL